jgi:tRNA nucleotidyltransferase (CCA-adding enzyme)
MGHGELSDRLRALEGMEAVLPALDGLPPAYLVGGAVRDLLRGARTVDLDVCMEGDAVAAAGVLAERLGGEAVTHERFGTATVRAGRLSVDLARTRRETYERPGALPAVEPAGLEEDLGRRDFTVNAMAAALAADELGQVHDPHGGRRDLADGVIRVLHPRSFLDDPTRLLRAVRYEARLGGAMDAATEARAREAVADGAPATVSGSRVREALLDLLSEEEVPRAVGRLAELGLDRALHPALRADEARAAAAALGSVETGADRNLAVLATLLVDAPEELAPWLEGLGLTRSVRERVARVAQTAPALALALEGERTASELHALMSPEPPETLAVALALGAPAEPVLRFLSDLRGIRLEVTGAELLEAGAAPSPALGRALEETLRRKLDGEVAGREEELRVALELVGGARR